MILLNIEFSWSYLVYTLFIFLIFIGVRILLNYLRKQTIKQLNNLLYGQENYFLYQELLNNKRLKYIFRKQMLDIMRLNGYLLEGNDKKIVELIEKLDIAKLEPYEKLDYYQKRFSYFVEHRNKEEAKKSLLMLKNLFKKTSNIKVKKLLDEAELIYGIYIKRDTKLINELIEKTKTISDPLIKGITEYRIAKLYYYANNHTEVDYYLAQAKENVLGSYWYPVVIAAQKDHRVLEKK